MPVLIKKRIQEEDVDKSFYNFLLLGEFDNEEKKLLDKAYKFAKVAHSEQTRYNGDSFISHPVEVAKIVAFDIGLSTNSVVAALLHDTFTNTDIDISFLEISFEKNIVGEIKRLINGLIKIKGTSNYFDNDKLTVYQKLIESLAEDLRIIYIKIADRLHNMRTLDSLEPHRKQKISSETLYVYVPLAERLGLYSIKSELEDLAFKYLDYKNYSDISQRILNNENKNIMKLNRFSLPIIAKLVNEKYDFEIISRQKSVYSIWKKMQRKNIPFEQVYDILAIRIIFVPKIEEDEKEECRKISQMIEKMYEIKHDRTRDWLNEPKSNGYTAIHVTAKASYGEWVEIQIRSQNMNYIAEHGLAAHWKYKGFEERKKEFDEKIENIKKQLKSVDKSKIDFSNDFKTLIGQDTFIYVYTPKGKEIVLENGSTVLDFAFSIHTNLGCNCIGAKVNNVLKPIDYVLNTGDEVFVLTLKNQEPKKEWLEIAKTEKAKAQIKEYLKVNLISEYEKGKKILDEVLNEQKIEPGPDLFKHLLNNYKLSKRETLINIGKGEISKEELINTLKKFSKRKFFFFKPTVKNKKYEFSNLITASCCNPIPGDEVIGIQNNNVVVIHRNTCEQILKINDETNKFPLTWEVYKAKSFYTKIAIEAENRKGIFFQISRILSKDLEVNIKSIHFDTIDDELLMSGWIEIYVLNINHLNKIIDEISALDGILKVQRI